jgi:hypothetical protein
VKCNDWVFDGGIGIILELRRAIPAQLSSAYVHLSTGIKFVSLENLELISPKQKHTELGVVP